MSAPKPKSLDCSVDAIMARIDIKVPYAQRAKARDLGARWDPKARTWFIPSGLDAARFSKWSPSVVAALRSCTNVRGPGYFIAKSFRCCWRCHLETSVFGFALSPPYQLLRLALETHSMSASDSVWLSIDRSVWLYNVRQVPNIVTERLAELSSTIFLDVTATVDNPYLMNHCEHCDARLGDEHTIGMFNAPLSPVYVTSMAKITLYSVPEPFEASAEFKFNNEIDPISLCKVIEHPGISPRDQGLEPGFGVER